MPGIIADAGHVVALSKSNSSALVTPLGVSQPREQVNRERLKAIEARGNGATGR